MTEFFSNTAVRIAIATVGTAAVAAGSYLIGQHNGYEAAMGEITEIVERLVEEAKNVTTN